MHVLAWKDAQDIFNFFFRKNFTLLEKITKTVEEIPTNPSRGFSKCWHFLPHLLYIFLSPLPHIYTEPFKSVRELRVNALLSLNTVVYTKARFKALFKEGWLQDRLYSVSPFF